MLFTAGAEEAFTIIDSIDMSRFQQAAENTGSGIDVKSTILAIASGETRLDGEFIKNIWNEWRAHTLSHVRGTFVDFLGPIMLVSLFARVFPANRSACQLIGACCCAGIFLDVLTNSLSSARTLLHGIAGVMETALPLLTALSAMGGGTASAALLTPMATLTGEVMVSILGKWGIFLCCGAGLCACACAIGSRFRLDGIFALLKRMVQVGAGLMLALFAGILKVQGMLGTSFDSAAVKTARFAIDKFVPVVGGGISDTMDAAISSIMLINSAVGVTGMLVIVTACAGPVFELAAALMGIRLARAVAQPVSDGPLIDAAERFGDVIRLMLVICLTAVTLGLILIGAAVGAGRSLT